MSKKVNQSNHETNNIETKKEELKEEKAVVSNIAINKYSVSDLKSTMDSKIIEHLESLDFKENNYYSNLKIITGLYCIFWTCLAYLNGKEFPHNYNIICISLVFYFLGTIVYWYIESYIIKETIYVGSNNSLYPNLEYIKLESISDYETSKFDYPYTLNVYIKEKNKKDIKINNVKANFINYFDERGYCIKSKVEEFIFTNILDEIEGKGKNK